MYRDGVPLDERCVNTSVTDMNDMSDMRMSGGTARKGFFVTIEGGEGTGKSTAVAELEKRLARLQYPVVATREPGKSSIGITLRNLLLERRHSPISMRTEALLLAAERAQHTHEVIRPALDTGALVICDRFLDSSIAYQGFARKLGVENIRQLSLWATGGILPNLTLVLDLPAEEGLRRRFQNQSDVNRLDEETMEFHKAVRAGYQSIAAAEPERVTCLNVADLSPVEVVELLEERILSAWNAHQSPSAAAFSGWYTPGEAATDGSETR